MFKRLLRWRLRRKNIDDGIVVLLSERDAFVQLLRRSPSIRTYVTPEQVERALAQTAKSPAPDQAP